MIKPIMTSEVEGEVLDAVAQYLNRDKWIVWGMATLRDQGACVLLEGPAGCGKTVIAEYLGKKIRKGFKRVSVADFGGGSPGETEGGIKSLFEDAKKRHNMTLFLDECDSILRKREDITGDGLTWMVGCAEEMLVQIADYKGLVILATNFAQVLDPALERRLLAKIHIGRPHYAERVRLWKQKWPERFPLKPTQNEIETLSKFDLSGAQIETVFTKVASHAIRIGKKPTLSLFINMCEAVEQIKIQ